MLLIDARSGRVASTDPSHLRLPTVAHGPWRSPEDAKAWLRRLKVAEIDLLRVLASELERAALLPLGGGATSAAIEDAGARALASSKIAAGTRIDPAALVVRFHDEAPEADLKHEAWVRSCGWLDFRTEAGANAFVTDLAKNPDSAAQVARALGHPAGAAWRKGSGASSGQGDLPGLLRNGVLTLRPETTDLRVWRIAWPSRRAAGAPLEVDYGPVSSGRSAPALPPPAPKGPVSSLPAPSDTSSSSPQAQALIAAAQSGAPYCEECARAAEEEADAAAAAPAPADLEDILPAPPADDSPQVQALIAAAQSGAPFCAECARLAAEQTGDGS
jgi:hypothetical protein